ncbi:methyltransferase [Nonomuraea turkmeniaca]|uniref:Methyltransferase n=1 Tax=Nonomuraea turkmeniaca TaxID=103838 RepID=A0A5S4FXC7_9ACTN|nr:methyltransferase [Nonomuraea turkmeniaca]TMR24781.1 methyltransferase [Nonomuraea turkmeniaca]
MHDEATRLLTTLISPWTARAVYTATRLGLFDALAGEPRSAGELADTLGLKAEPLSRLLRLLSGLDLLERRPGPAYGLTSSGRLLRTGVEGSLRGLAVLYGEDYFARAWEHLDKALRTGTPAFDQAFGNSVFDHLGARPDAAAIYNEGMAATAAFMRAVPEACDLSVVRTVVDVAGGNGALLAVLLQAAPHARGVLLDLPEVAAAASAHLATLGMASRCETVGGDFFARVPPGGDLYVLSRTLHNWDDAQCQTILGNCAAAMPPGARLLVIERMIPTHRDPVLTLAFDLHMLVMTTGRERTEEEYAELLVKAGLIPEEPADLPIGLALLPARKP